MEPVDRKLEGFVQPLRFRRLANDTHRCVWQGEASPPPPEREEDLQFSKRRDSAASMVSMTDSIDESSEYPSSGTVSVRWARRGSATSATSSGTSSEQQGAENAH